MTLTYFKRYRMEIDLTKRDYSRVAQVSGYRLVSWDQAMLPTHAEIKYLSFRAEIDAQVFPCLGDLGGCNRLMAEISKKPGFMPEATWLVAQSADGRIIEQYCGTIQGIRDRNGLGAIQNLGIIPSHRGHGLGALLLQRALFAFQRAGLRRALLEVTEGNQSAIRLYHRLGFQTVRTVYKVVETPTSYSHQP